MVCIIQHFSIHYDLSVLQNNPQQLPYNNPAVATGDAPPQQQQQEQQQQFDAGVDHVVQLPPLDGVIIGNDQQLVDNGSNTL